MSYGVMERKLIARVRRGRLGLLVVPVEPHERTWTRSPRFRKLQRVARRRRALRRARRGYA